MQKKTVVAEPTAVSKLLFACDLTSSTSEAKRMVRQSAVSIDGNKVTDPNEEIIPWDGMVIQVGKRKFIQLELAGD